MMSSRIDFHASRRPSRLALETLESRVLMTVNMSPQEQLFLELVNRARADPEAEVRRNPDVATLNQEVADDRLISSEPKQPLAPHQSLIDAMIVHAEDMLQRNFFGHDNPDGKTPSDRARAAGYPTGAGENIAWSGNTGGINQDEQVYLRHAGLFESVGHRVNMMRERWREIGPGIRYGVYTQDDTNYQSIMAGTLFGNRTGNNFITGVALTDFIRANNFYDIGEGIGNARISAVNTLTSEVYTEWTGFSGGYSLQVPDGIFDITATGDNISHPLVVRGVRVDGENVKVDFNTRFMDTRYIEGRFYEDNNGNQRRDAGDLVLANQTAYVDLNRNSSFDDGEPATESDSTGAFRFDSLLPGSYVVRSMIPNAYLHTTQSSFLVNVGERNIVGVDFGLQAIDSLPIATNDQATGLSGEEITLDVLGNDSDADGGLDIDSIRIVTLPANGTVSVRGQNIVYKSNTGFVGRDSFSYTVDDDAGQRSNQATVSLEVQNGKPWQNPLNRRDVDGDGTIAPRDVLALVRELNEKGTLDLRNQTRLSDALYFDVSGDGFLSPIDVLLVVTHLNNAGSGEPPAQSADAFFAALALANTDD